MRLPRHPRESSPSPFLAPHERGRHARPPAIDVKSEGRRVGRGAPDGRHRGDVGRVRSTLRRTKHRRLDLIQPRTLQPGVRAWAGHLVRLGKLQRNETVMVNAPDPFPTYFCVVPLKFTRIILELARRDAADHPSLHPEQPLSYQQPTPIRTGTRRITSRRDNLAMNVAKHYECLASRRPRDSEHSFLLCPAGHPPYPRRMSSNKAHSTTRRPKRRACIRRPPSPHTTVNPTKGVSRQAPEAKSGKKCVWRGTPEERPAGHFFSHTTPSHRESNERHSALFSPPR
jgi:hypothetical protein